MPVSVVSEAAVRRAAKEAWSGKTSRVRIDESAGRTREHPVVRPEAAVGVLASLALAGIRLSPEQRAKIGRLLKLHGELSTHFFTPEEAVERLIVHGVEFTEEQLAKVTDEDATISGIRRATSSFEAYRPTTGSNRKHVPRSRPEPQRGGLFAWLRRIFAFAAA